MIVDSEFDYDRIRRLSGKCQIEMHNAMRGWVQLSTEQRTVLYNFYNLLEILTIEDIPKVQNALMIIRQLRDRVQDLVKHFALVPAVHTLESSLELMNSNLESGEMYAEWILSYRP